MDIPLWQIFVCDTIIVKLLKRFNEGYYEVRLKADGSQINLLHGTKK